MKKSVEIIGLPIISITEGRELGMSKSLLIDAKNGNVAAITIEDDDWYRGVKLLPYSSVIAIGEDAVTITGSENILTLEDASDYEAIMDANIRIIGTKAITKTGTIQGKVNEIYVGDNGKIEKVTIIDSESAESEISSDQISIFGKQVTVIDAVGTEKKNELVAKTTAPAAQPAPAKTAAPTASPAPAAAAAAQPATKPEAPKAEAPKAEAPKAEPSDASDSEDAKKTAADTATEDRHRRFLLGKKAARKITTDSGVVIVEAGADITEEVLQKAKLANKFMELSMNVQ